MVSRAYFKLQELDAKFDLLKPKQSILELGAAPGGWVRYIDDKLSGHENLYIAVDPSPVKSSGLAKIISGKSSEPWVSQEIERILELKKLDLVLSDMAPNISYTDKSNTPNAIEGTGINFEVSIPSCATLSKTSFIIPLFLIMLAVMLFMEDARAKNIGVGSPV